MGAAFETSVPLVLMEASGKDFLWRSTWSVARKDGPGGAPFLLSRSQMANLHVVLILGADSVAVKTPSGKPVILAAGVRGGHLVLPTHPWGEAGDLGSAGGPERHTAICDPKSAVRSPQIPRARRKAREGIRVSGVAS